MGFPRACVASLVGALVVFAVACAGPHVASSGSSATAVVHLDAPNEPGTHYNVGLIEEPRPSPATCGPGAAGTAFTGLDTEAAGVGTTTVQKGLGSGTTGVWVIVERPNPHSQSPAEYYMSEFVAPV